MATPLAQAEYKRMYETLGRQAGATTRWPRTGPGWSSCSTPPSAGSSWPPIREITGKEYRVLPTETPTEGVGCVEAPRGTLTHHYTTDERGILTKVNLIVGTTNNNAPICMSVKKAAQGLIKKGEGERGPAEHGRDGLPRLRPVLRLRHAQPARPDAAGDPPPRPARAKSSAADAVPRLMRLAESLS